MACKHGWRRLVPATGMALPLGPGLAIGIGIGLGLGLTLAWRIRSSSKNSSPAAQIHAISPHHTIERKQVQAKLEQSFAQLHELSVTLQTIREEERTHIARELHDDLGQLLATLRLDLTLLKKQVTGQPGASRLLKGMDELLMAAITSLRRIASNLRPLALDEGGLYFALHSLRHDFTTRYGIACSLDASEHDLILNDTYSTAIFRIVQEALTNIARHAHASEVKLSLHRSDASLQLTIQDDGRGIDGHDMDKAASFGLVGMRERVRAIHGDMSILSDGGTRIAISMPLPPSDARADKATASP